MSKYDEMSDLEVDVLLASHLYQQCNHAHTVDKNKNKNGEAEFWCADHIGGTRHAGKYNYCNCWLDIGPLIEEYRVDIEHPVESLGGIGRCSVYRDGDTDVTHDFKGGVMRASAICIIKLLES